MHSFDEAREFSGTLADGTSARAVPVRVRLRADGLYVMPDAAPRETVRRRGGDQADDMTATAQRWPYEVLVSSGPLLVGEPVLLGHRDRPGTRLTLEPDILAPLLERAPRLSGRGRARRLVLPMGLVAVLMAAVLGWWWFSGFSLAQVVADMLPRGMHVALGQAVARDMTKGRACAEPDGVAALRTLLLKVTGDRARMRDYRVVVARLGMVNAFAAPGGHVVLAEELVRFARSPDELAGVLAHELGHVDMRHSEAAMVRAAGLSLVGMLLFGDSNIGGLALLMVQTRFSRQAEREADAIVVRRLRAAGIDPAALAAFFERLQKRRGGTGEESRLAALFSTHPPTAERMQALRRAALTEARPALDAVQWRALRNICASSVAIDEAWQSEGAF